MARADNLRKNRCSGLRFVKERKVGESQIQRVPRIRYGRDRARRPQPLAFPRALPPPCALVLARPPGAWAGLLAAAPVARAPLPCAIGGGAQEKRVRAAARKPSPPSPICGRRRLIRSREHRIRWREDGIRAKERPPPPDSTCLAAAWSSYRAARGRRVCPPPQAHRRQPCTRPPRVRLLAGAHPGEGGRPKPWPQAEAARFSG